MLEGILTPLTLPDGNLNPNMHPAGYCIQVYDYIGNAT